MKTRLYQISILLLFLSSFLNAQQFKIVYLADEQYARDSQWLDKIRDVWQATGVNLRITRAIWVGPFGNDYKNEILMALDSIKENNLDVYIRLSMGLIESSWNTSGIYNFKSDFHKRATPNSGNDYYYYNTNFIDPVNPRPVLNLTARSRDNFLIPFINEVIIFLKNWQTSRRALGKDADIELLVPSISPDDETCLPSAGYNPSNGATYWELTGYTETERLDFITYLQNYKYPGGFDQLKTKWNAPTLAEWNSIQPKNYNWQTIWGPYTYPNGRKDFIDFRTYQLTSFFDLCSNIINTNDFKFGLQFGSLYDGGIELAGFYDPTMLVKNADYIINDDVPEYSLQFDFVGDYLRSLCKYWDKLNSKDDDRIFGTETNWPEYSVDGLTFSDNTLMYYWGEQLDKCYNKGGMILFISHWGTNDKTLSSGETIPIAVKTGILESRYDIWKNKLSGKKNINRATIPDLPPSHLSCEQVLFYRDPLQAPYYDGHYHNQPNLNGAPIIEGITWRHFPLYYFTKPRNSYILGNVYYNENSDIITNKMINNSPDYLRTNYNEFYLNETSYYMPSDVYDILQNLDQNYGDSFIIDNETWISPSSFMFTPGTKNEYNEPKTIFYNWRYLSRLHKLSIEQKNKDVKKYHIFQNYPNPFNPSTIISYEIPKAGNVSLKVFSTLGQIVKELVSEYKDEGKYEVIFDGINLSNGIYFYELKVNGYKEMKKMILLK